MRQTTIRSMSATLLVALGLTSGCATPRLYQPVEPGLLLFSQDGNIVERDAVARMLEASDAGRPVLADGGFATLDTIYQVTGIAGLSALAAALIMGAADANAVATTATGGAGLGLDVVSLAFLIASNVVLGDGVRAHNAALPESSGGAGGVASGF